MLSERIGARFGNRHEPWHPTLVPNPASLNRAVYQIGTHGAVDGQRVVGQAGKRVVGSRRGAALPDLGASLTRHGGQP